MHKTITTIMTSVEQIVKGMKIFKKLEVLPITMVVVQSGVKVVSSGLVDTKSVSAVVIPDPKMTTLPDLKITLTLASRPFNCSMTSSSERV